MKRKIELEDTLCVWEKFSLSLDEILSFFFPSLLLAWLLFLSNADCEINSKFLKRNNNEKTIKLFKAFEREIKVKTGLIAINWTSKFIYFEIYFDNICIIIRLKT